MDTKRILIIDDSLDYLELMALIFKGEGYQVSLATDGDVGLKQIEKYSPDLIILDLHMPYIDGYQFLMHFCERNLKVPIILVTAGLFPKSPPEGVTKIIRKPMSIDYLTKEVAQLLKDNP